jgi:uncharacterized lipoprotein YmbA
MRDDLRLRFLRPLASGALASLTLWLAGCQILPDAQPDRTRYFVLSTPPTADASEKAGGASIGLRAVELPGYLRNTRSMVVARGPNELTFREEERWAEPLEVGLSRVFRETLLASDGIAQVTVFPFPSEQSRDFDLLIRLLHCEGVDTGGGRPGIRFALHYELTRAGAGGEVVQRRHFVAPAADWDGEPGTLAARLAEAAAAAAAAIAANLP